MINPKFDKLKYLLEKKKFADSEWEKRGLNPSSSELCEQMENKLNQCLNSLINLIEHNSSQNDLKKSLRQSLKTFDKSNFDTEEKEFICDYFNEISKSIEIDFKNDLNKVTSANISVRVTDDFMMAVEQDKDFILKYPVDKTYKNIDLSNINYNELINVEMTDGSKGYIKKVKAKSV